MINTRLHGMIDYATGALLLVAPYLFGFATGGIEQWLPQLLGAMIIVMSLLTNYELSAAKMIPLKAHLAADVVAGVLLAASPWLFGFADVIWWPHLLVGLLEIVVPLLTRRDALVRV
ncbi:MAG: SPW repeat domain-containing protein [Albimonas sp.]|uniref:SPW repeat domain-containing protein n=1 Tax=Albimonas sp. TaxID=1872425 RepID=UPI004055C88E|tara:strand:- start:2013 stop:2363 length:351 start_codon:yes stop_codon:yes gene_type:complete